MADDMPTNETILMTTRFLQLVDRQGWYFVRREGSRGVVAIVAVTPNDELILVEQYRPPLMARVLELPAGLAGDIAGSENEPLDVAARRELLEETGYTCRHLECLTHGPSSAGLTDEMIWFFRAHQVEQVDSGGGDEHEQIQVHHVPLIGIHDWLRERQQAGLLIDYKIFAGLLFVLHGR